MQNFKEMIAYREQFAILYAYRRFYLLFYLQFYMLTIFAIVLSSFFKFHWGRVPW